MCRDPLPAAASGRGALGQKVGRQALSPTGAQLATSPFDAWRTTGWLLTTRWLKAIAKTAMVRVMIVIRRITVAIVLASALVYAAFMHEAV